MVKDINDYVKVTAWAGYRDDGTPSGKFGRKHFINHEETETLCSISLPKTGDVEYCMEMGQGFCKICLKMVKHAEKQK